MKNLSKIVCFVVMALLCSCGTTKKNFYNYSKVKTYGRFTEKLSFEANPLVCDVEVKGKVTGSYVGAEGDKRDFVMGMAERNALKKGNADVLVAPDYEVDFDGTVFKATVTAYVGVYKNFRNKVEKEEGQVEFVTVPVCPTCGSMNKCMAEPHNGKCAKHQGRDKKK